MLTTSCLLSIPIEHITISFVWSLSCLYMYSHHINIHSCPCTRGSLISIYASKQIVFSIVIYSKVGAGGHSSILLLVIIGPQMDHFLCILLWCLEHCLNVSLLN